jgi:mono/diheme cytochrome c family protein
MLALALVLFVRAGPRPGIKTSIAAVLAAASAGVLLYLLSQWPGVPGMPANPGVVTPDTGSMPAERVRMVERGHYLYPVSCALCHGTDGRGGTPISWKPFHIVDTQHHFALAIRRRRLDRPRFGAAHSQRYQEDLRAIIAYVRVLPPVCRAVPLRRPSAADDCGGPSHRLDRGRGTRDNSVGDQPSGTRAGSANRRSALHPHNAQCRSDRGRRTGSFR